MQMRTFLTLLAASGAAAQTGVPSPPPMNGTITTTIVVNSFVTYCPKPTVITWKDQCYTAKQPGPLTITNCPCTITTTMPKPTWGPPPPGKPEWKPEGGKPPPPPPPPPGCKGPECPAPPPPPPPMPPCKGPECPAPPPPPPVDNKSPPPPPPPAQPPVAPMPAPPPPGQAQATGAWNPPPAKPTYVTAGANGGLKVSGLLLAGALAGVAAL